MTRRVAVAGGTGGLGRTLIEQILAETDYEVVIFTRREEPLKSSHRVQYAQVDYEDVPLLARELERYAVETVICVIGLYGEDRADAQRNLIKAAKESSVFRRFMPCEFGYMTLEKYEYLDPGVLWYKEASELLKAAGLTFTRVIGGIFMDFLALQRVPSNIAGMPLVVDIPNRRACIPGDGNEIMSWTYSYDLATFTAKLLDVDEWSEFSFFAGENATFNQVVQIAEEVCGEKFYVTYGSYEELAQGALPVPELPEGSQVGEDELRAFNIMACTLIHSGAVQLPSKGHLNGKFPDFRPKTIRELMKGD